MHVVLVRKEYVACVYIASSLRYQAKYTYPLNTKLGGQLTQPDQITVILAHGGEVKLRMDTSPYSFLYGLHSHRMAALTQSDRIVNFWSIAVKTEDHPTITYIFEQ